MASSLEVLVNGIPLDLEDKIVFQQSFAPISLVDPLNIGGRTNSNIITLKQSDTNLRALGFPNFPSSGSRIFLSTLDCQVRKNGIPIVKNGRLVIERVTKENIFVTIYSRNIDLLENISDESRLGQLVTPLISSSDTFTGDGDTDVFQWDAATMIAKIEGGEFPITDYGDLTDPDTAQGDVELSKQYWAVPVKRIIKAIFEEGTGKTPIGSFFDSNELFNTMNLAFTNEEIISDQTQDPAYFEASLGTQISFNDQTPIADNNYSIIYDNEIADPGNNYDPVTGVYTSPQVGNVSFSYVGQFQDTLIAFAGVNRTHRVFVFSSLKGDIGGVNFTTESSQTVRVTFNTNQVSAVLGETFQLRITIELGSSPSQPIDAWLNLLPEGSNWKSVFRTPAAGFNSFINIKQNLPDLGQREFLTAIAGMFGLFFVTSENEFATEVAEDEVLLLTFDQIGENFVNASDISNIIDLSKEIEIDYHLEEFGQNNLLIYGQNETDIDIEQLFGSGNFLIADQSLQSSAVYLEIPFAASRQVSVFDRNASPYNIAAIPRFTGGAGSYVLTETSNPRFLLRTREQTKLIRYRAEGAATTPSTSNDFYKHEFDQVAGNLSLAFGNIINNELQTLIATFQQGYYLNLNIFLNSVDIHKLAFTNLFYINLEDNIVISDYFLPLSINNFSDENKSTRAVLFPITRRSSFEIPILPETQAWLDAIAASGAPTTQPLIDAVNRYIYNALFGPAPWWNDTIDDWSFYGTTVTTAAIGFKLSGLMTLDGSGGAGTFPGGNFGGFRSQNTSFGQVDLTAQGLADNWTLEAWILEEFTMDGVFGIDAAGNNSDLYAQYGTGAPTTEFKAYNNGSRFNPTPFSGVGQVHQVRRATGVDHQAYKDSVSIGSDSSAGGTNPLGSDNLFIGGLNNGAGTRINNTDAHFGGFAVFDTDLTDAQLSAQFISRQQLQLDLFRI